MLLPAHMFKEPPYRFVGIEIGTGVAENIFWSDKLTAARNGVVTALNLHPAVRQAASEIAGRINGCIVFRKHLPHPNLIHIKPIVIASIAPIFPGVSCSFMKTMPNRAPITTANSRKATI